MASEVPRTIARDHFDAPRVAALARATSVSAVIPAHNEVATVGQVVTAVRASGVVTETIVVDDASHDMTAAMAERHGARVVRLACHTGKGGAMTAGAAASTGEIVVFLDADVLSPMVDFVPRMIHPLLEDDDLQLVKAFYRRPLHNMHTGGGRVTELAARPVLALLYPGLGEIRQPLAGETALRREALNAVELASGYSVEIALLIDIFRKYGPGAIAQVDLNVRRHRNRPLEELRPMAVNVLRTALERYEVEIPD